MRTTSAPRSASTIAQNGPGPMPATSITFMPRSGPAIASNSPSEARNIAPKPAREGSPPRRLHAAPSGSTRGSVPFVTARGSRVADGSRRMVHARPRLGHVTRSPRLERAFVVALCGWALFAVACATAPPAAHEAGPVYGAPRALESFDFAQPVAVAEAPDAAPI